MIRRNTKKHAAKTLVMLSLFSASLTAKTLAAAVEAQAATALTRSGVNFRSGPSTGRSVIRKLSAQTPIDVISHNPYWSKINESGEVGYISSDYIRFTSTGVIHSRVNLRSKGSTSGTVITKIPKGESVKVLSGPVNGWYKVTFGAKTGYIDKDYVKVDETAALKAELNKPAVGLILVYDLQQFSAFEPVTAWNITFEPNPSQLLLLTKKKGSLVEVSKAKLTGDERVVIPGEVIRHWKPTADEEVIRITYNDPEVIPYYFVTVKEPGAKTTTTSIQMSQKADFDWLAFPYDK